VNPHLSLETNLSKSLSVTAPVPSISYPDCAQHKRCKQCYHWSVL